MYILPWQIRVSRQFNKFQNLSTAFLRGKILCSPPGEDNFYRQLSTKLYSESWRNTYYWIKNQTTLYVLLLNRGFFDILLLVWFVNPSQITTACIIEMSSL